jgi:glycosyltransferase involved in cell wall biosynthesis
LIEVSVVICSHNPRQDYLRRVLEALHGQTLPKCLWELILVDNASARPLKLEWDVSWHPQGRHVREDQLGLTCARLTGIKHSKGELIVFVDDDNLLESNYLESACSIAKEFPQIGAFGCCLTGEFETPVPDWAVPYLEGLCLKKIGRDRWANDYTWSDALPYGAGMCVRSVVARRYCADVEKKHFRKILDRSGGRLTSGGDIDLAWTAIDVGLGTGRFCALKAVHLIPSGRLTQDYIVRLYAGFTYSNVILWSVRGLSNGRPRANWRETLRLCISFVKLRGVPRQIYFASRQAHEAAWRALDDGEAA